MSVLLKIENKGEIVIKDIILNSTNLINNFCLMACLIRLNSEEVRQPGKFQNLAQVVSHHGSQFLILAVIQDG